MPKNFKQPLNSAPSTEQFLYDRPSRLDHYLTAALIGCMARDASFLNKNKPTEERKADYAEAMRTAQEYLLTCYAAANPEETQENGTVN